MVAITFPAVLAVLSCVLPAVSAASHAVIDPKITLPDAGMQWPIGSTQKVTWEYPGNDPSVAEKHVTILLGHQDCDDCSENLDSGTCPFFRPNFSGALTWICPTAIQLILSRLASR